MKEDYLPPRGVASLGDPDSPHPDFWAAYDDGKNVQKKVQKCQPLETPLSPESPTPSYL